MKFLISQSTYLSIVIKPSFFDGRNQVSLVASVDIAIYRDYANIYSDNQWGCG